MQKSIKTEKISAGSFDLNKWLFGGYEKDIITMIAGNAGSGKTNLCILAACSQAKKGNKVIFIDTEGGFSTDRVRQVTGTDYEKCLKKILLLNPTSFEEQKHSFEKLLQMLNETAAKNSLEIGLIVIDGVGMLYRLSLGDAIKTKDEEKIREVNREAARQMKILTEIARKQNIPILITNQVYSEFLSEDELRKGKERTTNIVGGNLFEYWSKCIIELVNDKDKRKAILLKHRSLPRKELQFEIKDKGIFKKR